MDHKSTPDTRAESQERLWWVEVLRWAALLVFVAIPVFGYLVQPWAGRVVWTIAVAALPLFIVLVGYHRWRRICPLAFFAQLPNRLGLPGKRKASGWLEQNYYLATFSIFLFSLWLRLIATNGDGRAIATFFVALSFTAFVFGAIYTGKTWCNHICPVSFVEKIYTEPHGLRATENSQCTKCSACKKFCPDISEENGYWKEILSGPKRIVYFSFPGVVFGFYFYYYLQAGTWDYYFSGRWTNEAGLFQSAFGFHPAAQAAGFFFLPFVPRAAASALTLIVCGAASLLLFLMLERFIHRFLRRRSADADPTRTRHLMFSLAGFTAFVTFYSFAGQPSLRKLTFIPATQLVAMVIVVTATVFLTRRLRRTQAEFAEETLARNIIRRWPWTDVKPPQDLREAFLLHNVRTAETTKNTAQMLELYKNAVQDVLADGFASREEINQLTNLRSRLGIKESAHEKVMSSLAIEQRNLLIDVSTALTAEKRLQLETYANALRAYLARATSAPDADDRFAIRLRREFGLTKQDHEQVLNKVLGGERGLELQLAEELRTIARTTHTTAILDATPSPTHSFLAHIMRRRRSQALRNLFRGLNFAEASDGVESLRNSLFKTTGKLRQQVSDQLRTSLPRESAERLIEAYRAALTMEVSLPLLTDVLRARLKSVDPYVRAVALLALFEAGAIGDDDLQDALDSDHQLVRETAAEVLRRRAMANQAGPDSSMVVERMVRLGTIPMFAPLPLAGLTNLARSADEMMVVADEPVRFGQIAEGDLLVITEGEIEVCSATEEQTVVISTERAGTFINEFVELETDGNSIVLKGGPKGARVLTLTANAFGEALNA